MIGQYMRGGTCFFLLGSLFDLILENGDIYACGQNKYGQFGVGTNQLFKEPVLIKFFKGKKIKNLVSGHHTLILTEDNKLYGFGYNKSGQLGIGNQENQLKPVEITFFQDKNIQKIECGSYHTFVLADNILYAFGWNEYGQLGIGNTKNQDIPIEIPFFKDKEILDISLGEEFSLVYTRNYKLYAFGNNDNGQLGIGNTTDKSFPVEVSFFNDKMIKRIQSGARHTLISVIENDIEVLYCFGDNSYGKLGIGNTEDQLSPCKLDFKVDRDVKIQIHLTHFNTYIFTNQFYSNGYNGEGRLGQDFGSDQYKPQLIEFFKDKKIKTIFGKKEINSKRMYIQILDSKVHYLSNISFKFF